MTTRHRNAFVMLLAAVLSGCGGHPGDPLPVVTRLPARAPVFEPGTGLLAMCAGDNVVRVDYQATSTGFEGALFLSTTRTAIYNGAPTLDNLVGGNAGNAIFTNQSHPQLVTNGTRLFAGFAIRRIGTTTWSPIGSVIHCKPGAPIYVDIRGPASGDGSSPQSALPLLREALASASFLASLPGIGHMNVWVAAGTYTAVQFNPGIPASGPFAVGADVHVYGGFAPGDQGNPSAFAIEDRTLPPQSPTSENSSVLVGDIFSVNGQPTSTPRILDMLGGGGHVLDGMVIDGQSVNVKGIDITDSDAELRSVRMRSCTDNGLQIKLVTDFTIRRDVTLVASEVNKNGNDGVGISGIFDLELDRSDFSSNGGDGIDPNDLFAPTGGSASLKAYGCRFYGNLTDGLGLDLNTIAGSVPPPGRFEVDVEGCSFSFNRRDGLFIDLDYDLTPTWYTSARIRNCVANGNRRSGIHFDADDQGDFMLDRVRCTGNAGDGLWIASEPDDPLTADDDGATTHVLVTNSSMMGNLGYGIRSDEGDKVTFASHCVIAGNRLGGFAAATTGPRGDNSRRISSAVNCVLWRQSSPFTNVRTAACWVENNINPFELAPISFAVATSNLNGFLSLASASSVIVGDAVEIGDNGTKMIVTSASAVSIQVDTIPDPQLFLAPESLFVYLDGATTSVTEDLRLFSQSLARGTGLTGAGQPPVDPGPHGSSNGGEPGEFDPISSYGLQLLKVTPAVAFGVLPRSEVQLVFDAEVSPSSLSTDRILSTAGTQLQLAVDANDARIVRVTPLGDWSGNDNLQVLPGLQSVGGARLGAPIQVPLIPR